MEGNIFRFVLIGIGIFFGSASVHALEAEADGGRTPIGVGVGFGRIGAWHERGVQIKFIQDESTQFVNYLGSNRQSVLYETGADLFRFDLQTYEFLNSYRYTLDQKLPIFFQAGLGLIGFWGDGYRLTQASVGVDPYWLKSLAVEGHASIGFSWLYASRFFLDWQWFQIARTRVVWMERLDDTNAMAQTFSNMIENSRWSGFVNVAIGWIF